MAGIGLAELVLLLLTLVPAIIGGLLARAKGRNVPLWVVLCWLLWLPVLILLILPPAKRQQGRT